MQFSKWVTLGFGALCLVAVAGVLNAQHLYYMAAILLTLPGVSYALGWYTLRGLKFDRELPPTSWEGEAGQIVYAAHNRTRVSRFFMTVHEPLPSWIAPLDPEPPLFNVAANDTSRVVHRVEFRRRGVYDAQGFDVEAMDPLGVFAFKKRIPCEGELVVYPMPQQMRSVSLSGTERYGLQEFTAVALRGSSVDPDGVRQYVPGDPLRRIHWRQTAHTGRLSVMEFEENQSIHMVIALDLERGTDIGENHETTLEYGVRLAASLAQQAVQQGAGVRLLTQRPERQGTLAASLGVAAQAGRGQEHLYAILDALARVEAESLQSIGGLIHEAVGSLPPGSTLVVITARPDPALAGALARYTATGATVLTAYVDPASFAGGRGRISPAESQQFIMELLSVQVRPYIVRRTEIGDLSLEAIADADIRSAEPALA